MPGHPTQRNQRVLLGNNIFQTQPAEGKHIHSTASPRDGSNHRSHHNTVEEALEDSANVTIAVTMKTKAFHSIVAQRIVEAAD